MKELILFSFIVLFIACQNQQIPELKTGYIAPTPVETLMPSSEFESMACGNDSAETLDIAKEIQNQELPGIHYREVVLQSEMTSDLNQAELVCVSQVTASHEDVEAEELAVILPPAPEKSEEAPATWAVLTEKWEIVRDSKACALELSTAPDAKCEGPALWTEEGKLFSARFESAFDQISN